MRRGDQRQVCRGKRDTSMRHLRRTLAACALAALAIGVAGATSASATPYDLTGLPEIGRCVKAATPKTGEFRGPRCIAKQAQTKGEYHWMPGPGPNPAAEIHLTGTQVLETTTGEHK